LSRASLRIVRRPSFAFSEVEGVVVSAILYL
jgi:hypothetical protein